MAFWHKSKNFLYGYAMLTGTIIGVGIFSLPFITVRIGFPIVLAYFLLLGAVVAVIHIFWGEVQTKTKGHHRLSGMAKIYLGNSWSKLALISNIGGLFGAIVAYLVVGSEFLYTLLDHYLGGGQASYAIIYCFLGAMLVWLGTKAIARLEVAGIFALILVLILILVKAIGHLDFNNLAISADNGRNLFLPYGAVLFSLWGASALPEVRDILGRNKKQLRLVIVCSIISAVAVYFVFIALVVGLTGAKTTESALSGLNEIFGAEMGALLLMLGIITTFTSHVSLSLALKRVLIYDVKMAGLTAWFLAAILPVGFYFVGLNDFIKIISFVGAIMLAVDGIVIILMYNKAVPSKKRPAKIIATVLIMALLAGIVYEIIRIL
ncbi:hypothetical protein A3H03_00710 [Candidatus Kuenenbacteria bacterium RIFCSPLOWO2_12_FULL_42_13]|uniref:Amino acid transporter transmembrane domain-containing protein n=1 Tax=Candidatus Kuenenbacteria bacterium RIFCSPLOWO2_12_FULL_42_13 TaxID=1798565 RepID=A0A1F6G1J2_9BACT|nr:MAG: hypothetical protein A3H03_00710 [Candidatus Kuenenbacteria bacterium RIFCSPLOWO2_12_FULL_42_13]